MEKEKLTGTLMSEAELKNKKINRVVVVEMSTRLRGATIKQPVQDFFPDDDRKSGSCSYAELEGMANIFRLFP